MKRRRGKGLRERGKLKQTEAGEEVIRDMNEAKEVRRRGEKKQGREGRRGERD